MADGDSFVLDERLLKLGMIWQWKANKGSPYAEDMATYGDALVVHGGARQPGADHHRPQAAVGARARRLSVRTPMAGADA